MAGVDSASGRNRTLVPSLAKYLLVAHASGVEVEGEWRFVDTDKVGPDFSVRITRGDGAPAGPPFDRDSSVETDETGEFRADLYDLLLREIAREGDVAGRWELRYARPELPGWTVRIENLGHRRGASRSRPEDAR